MAIYALGDHVPTIEPTAIVDPQAVIIGLVRIARDAEIRAGAVLRGDGDRWVEIGERSVIGTGTVIHVAPGLATTVGRDCVIGERVVLEGCEVRDRASINARSVVLHRAVIGIGADVAAGSLVPNDVVVPDGASVAGIPVTPAAAGERGLQ